MGASARYRADRDAWYVFFRVGTRRWNKRVGSGPDAERDARAVADAFNEELEEKADRQSRLYPGGPAGFEHLAKSWWDARSPSMPNSSRAAKRPVVFHRLVPLLGRADVRRLDEDAVRAAAVHFAELGHARETVLETGSVLDTIVAWAVRKGVLERHPLEGRKGVRAIFREVAGARCPPKARVEAWTREEAAALLAVAAERGAGLHDAVLFACQTGCRRGELIALEWCDVDLRSRRATIRQSHTAGQTKTTKADKVRVVELSRAVVGALAARPRRHERVFLGPKGRPWRDHELHGYWTRARAVAAERNGVRPLKFHCWRHTWATWALAAGHDPAWCAAQIGDTLEVFLGRYAHAMPGIERSLDFLDVTPVPVPPAGARGRGRSAPARPAAARRGELAQVLRRGRRGSRRP